MSDKPNGTTVSRRQLLHGATILVSGAAVAATTVTPALAQSAQSGKMTQAAAAYQPSPKSGQKCLDCSLFVQPQACKLVEGTISPVGWCKFYAKKAS